MIGHAITTNNVSIRRKRRRRKRRKTNRKLDTTTVINLSSVQLTQDGVNLLSRGLTFCSTPTYIIWVNIGYIIVNARPTKIRDNLTKRERRALKRLIRREYKPADKGSGTVVMDMAWYENECLRQLNDTLRKN